jgi:antitoxin component HigA of HigAB toxin-antitoxin module
MATATVLDFSMPHVLRNAKEHKAPVAEIDRLLDIDPKRGTQSHDRLVIQAQAEKT